MAFVIWASLRAIVVLSSLVDFGFYGDAALGGIALLAASPLLVGLHEAGHALLAEAVGWRVRVFSVMNLSVRPSPWRIAYGVPVSGPFSAGSVFAVPPEGAWRYGWIV